MSNALIKSNRFLHRIAKVRCSANPRFLQKLEITTPSLSPNFSQTTICGISRSSNFTNIHPPRENSDLPRFVIFQKYRSVSRKNQIVEAFVFPVI